MLIQSSQVVLSASSPYFAQLFSGTPCQHPIVILNDIHYEDLKMVVEYMYRGEISVKQEQLESIMQVAESLSVRGLVDVSGQPSMSQVKTSPEPAVPPALIPTNVNKAEFCGNCSGYTPNKKRRLYEDPASNEKPLNCSRTPVPDHRTARTPTMQTPTGSIIGSGIDNRMPQSSMSSLRDPYSRTAPASPDMENYNDIRPDILEMIKEEQKVKRAPGNSIKL